MALFNRLFGREKLSELETVPNGIQFGRFIDSPHPVERNKVWNESLDNFKQKNYIESFRLLLEYIKDQREGFVNYQVVGNRISFQFTQGVKIIRGWADTKRFSAECYLAQAEGKNPALMRELLASNFQLRYCRFSLKEAKVFLKMDSSAEDASPGKLYYGLQELALKADRKTSALVRDFSFIKPIQEADTLAIPEKEKQIKVRFLKNWIAQTLSKTEAYNAEKDANIISHHLLALAYRIDYLIVPKDALWQKLEDLVGIYSAQDNKTVLERNKLMIAAFKEINEMQDESIAACLYNCRYTFDIIQPSTFKQVYEFILSQFETARLFVERKEQDKALVVLEQAFGYCLYYFGMYNAVYRLMDLLLQILYPEYFRELGFKELQLIDSAGKLNQPKITQAISEIIANERNAYPRLEFLTQNLRYQSMYEFVYNYLNEITYLNFQTQ